MSKSLHSSPHPIRRRRMRASGALLVRTALLFTALHLAVSCASDTGSGPSGVTTNGAENESVPQPGTEPAPDAEIPVPDGALDEIIYERLVGDGFSPAEAECLARSLTLGDLVSLEPSALVDVYGWCNISIERLIEVARVE